MSQSKKSILVIVIIVLLIAGGFLVYKYKTHCIDCSQPPATGEQVVDTTNWKVYKNPNYAFAIKYPDTWIATSSKDEDTAFVEFVPPEDPNNPDVVEGQGTKLFFSQDVNGTKVTTPEELYNEVEAEYKDDHPRLSLENLGGFDVVVVEGLPGVSEGNPANELFVLLPNGVLDIYNGGFPMYNTLSKP